jgi:hypothetical protein
LAIGRGLGLTISAVMMASNCLGQNVLPFTTQFIGFHVVIFATEGRNGKAASFQCAGFVAKIIVGRLRSPVAWQASSVHV